MSTSFFPAGLCAPGGDGALQQQMFHVIDNCDYLIDWERIICAAVLRIMPCRENNYVMRRFLAFLPSDLKFIPLIFRKGLLLARHFGFNPGTSSTPASTPSGSIRDDDAISTGSKRALDHDPKALTT